MSSNQAIHLIARYASAREFLQDYMYHVPSGGVFLDLGEETPPPLLAKDSRELKGHVVEIRVMFAQPKMDFHFRGAITYATPFEMQKNHRRIGIEFFRYETTKKNFLLDMIQNDQAKLASEISRRKDIRLPLHFRIRFSCSGNSVGLVEEGNKISVTGMTENISKSGCSFYTNRFLKPHTAVHVTLFAPQAIHPNFSMAPAMHPNSPMVAYKLLAKTRWQANDKFTQRMMGLQFDFTDTETQKNQEKLTHHLGRFQNRLEKELTHRT